MKMIFIVTWPCLIFCTGAFSQTANRNDVVIDEMMVDPSPPVGLPNSEWIELRNCSSANINLVGWRIGDATSQSGTFPAFILKPDSFVIVCTASAVASLSAFGAVIPVASFPSLDNTGDVIYLRSSQNKIIHSVAYKDSWYGNELKKQGGWTLEMTDGRNPCQGASNWKASIDVKGGTPGKKNSNDGANPDRSAPVLLRAYLTDSINITLVFDEPLDSMNASNINHYNISGGIGIPQKVNVLSPLFDRVNLKLLNPLQKGNEYSITVHAVTDCSGNPVENNSMVKTGISAVADSFDLVINEILFNPKDEGVDYVEIYNRSKKIIDLKNVFIANRNSAGTISSISQFSNENYLFFPGEYMVVTSDISIVKRDFITLNPRAMIEPGSMPSFNDDKGDVIILNEQGRIVDELAYSEKWHFKLIDNPEGVALERIDPGAMTQSADNWHSASSSAGYGTPTYKNSQFGRGQELKGDLTVSPGIISPDNDGIDDYATIGYSCPAPGYVANITIFDGAGRAVRYLQRNALCGIKGVFRWDGLGEKNQQLPVGIYILFTEVFNLEGKRKQFKNVMVLARRK